MCSRPNPYNLWVICHKKQLVIGVRPRYTMLSLSNPFVTYGQVQVYFKLWLVNYLSNSNLAARWETIL